MDKIPDSTNVIGEFFREGQGFAHQTTATLAKGVVEAFEAISLTAGFIDSFVTFGRQHPEIGLEEIGETHRALAIFRRQRIPQIFGSLRVARPDGTADNQPSVSVDG